MKLCQPVLGVPFFETVYIHVSLRLQSSVVIFVPSPEAFCFWALCVSVPVSGIIY